MSLEHSKANGHTLAMSREIPAVSVESGSDPIPLHRQKHFDINELAQLWGMSPNAVRHWFENEPGVLRISIGYRRGKDHRVALRIPESVAAKVHREKSRPDV